MARVEPGTGGSGDIGLGSVGVELDERGFVVVDDHLRTTNKRIWAAGDLTGHPQFTHTAGVHASLAASNAILGVRRTVGPTAEPRVTFTAPEVAAVGLETHQVPTGLRAIDWSHSHLDRAVTEGQLGGFTRLVVDKRGHVLGATVVGPRAGETLGELTIAIRSGLTTRGRRRRDARLTHVQRRTVECRDLRRPGPAPATGHAACPGTPAQARSWWPTKGRGSR